MHIIHTSDQWQSLKPGEAVHIAGRLLTCRDGVLRRIFEEEPQRAHELFSDALIYFCGPSPAPPGMVIGSCGPTTSSRMEPYFERLCAAGIKGIMGKGEISPSARAVLQKYHVPYFAGLGGAGALLATKVTAAEVIAYPEMGAEAVFELLVTDFPAVVA